MYIHTYVHTCIHTYQPTNIHTYQQTNIHTYIPTNKHTHIHMHTQTRGRTVIAQVDGAVLCHKERFLQEAQDDHGHNPELETHQVTEGAEHHHDPRNAVDRIHGCHHTIELRGGREEGKRNMCSMYIDSI